MTPFFPRPGRLAANAFEAAIENAILRADDLYDLDGETAFRRRDGRVETGSFDAFEKETF
ncbi:MAG: hypothetical protein ACK4TP_12795 [Hyphomicrobium sp.]